jgi:hypothetical protein
MPVKALASENFPSTDRGFRRGWRSMMEAGAKLEIAEIQNRIGKLA